MSEMLGILNQKVIYKPIWLLWCCCQLREIQSFHAFETLKEYQLDFPLLLAFLFMLLPCSLYAHQWYFKVSYQVFDAPRKWISIMDYT